jgi:hypothetical protein
LVKLDFDFETSDLWLLNHPTGMAFQKRQSLIPFPRVGRSRSITANNKLPLISASRTFQWDGKSFICLLHLLSCSRRVFDSITIDTHLIDLREGKRHLIPFPRVGKRQSLIPFPRVGRNDPFRDYSDLIKEEDDDTSMTAGDISDDSYIPGIRLDSVSCITSTRSTFRLRFLRRNRIHV